MYFGCIALSVPDPTGGGGGGVVGSVCSWALLPAVLGWKICQFFKKACLGILLRVFS